MYHSFFIHSSVYGHLGYFHVLAIVNGTAMITGLCDSFLNILNMYSFLIETQQPYNIVLFSTIEQHESTIGIHMSIPSWTSEPENIQKTKIMSSGPITLGQTDGETMETVTDFIWGGLQNHCRWWLQPLKDACSLEEKLWPTRQHVKKQRHYFTNKSPSCQIYGVFSSHVWM